MLSLLFKKRLYIHYICDFGFRVRQNSLENVFWIICCAAARGLYTPTTWREWSDPSYMEAAREMAEEVEAYEQAQEDEIEEDGKWKLKYCKAKIDRKLNV